MRQQNVGACAEASPYCFGLAKSAETGSHQDLAGTKCGVAAGCPTFMGRLSPPLYWLICTGQPCRKHHKYWHQQNIGGHQDLLIFAKL
jgi:hypothetical protein